MIIAIHSVREVKYEKNWLHESTEITRLDTVGTVIFWTEFTSSRAKEQIKKKKVTVKELMTEWVGFKNSYKKTVTVDFNIFKRVWNI